MIIDNVASQNMALQDDLIKLAKTLHDVIEEIIAGDDKTNENLAMHQKWIKENIIKGK